MAKFSKLIPAVVAVSKKATASVLNAPKTPRPPRKPKGRLISFRSLSSKEFESAIKDAVVGYEKDLAQLNLHTINDLKKVLMEAHKRLGKERVTLDDWLGRAFEVIGPTLPEVVLTERLAVNVLQITANRFVTERKSGFTFMNGYFEPAGVKKPFKTVEVAYNLKIKEPGQTVGRDFADRANLLGNSDGEKLPIRTEFKTRGAAGGLKSQIGASDDRILGGEGHKIKSRSDLEKLYNAKEGAKITYEVEGQKGIKEIDLEKVILLRDTRNPSLTRDVDLYGKIGVRAGKEFKLGVATDSRGGDYIRVIVPAATDSLRQLIKRVLRNRSWQKVSN